VIAEILPRHIAAYGERMLNPIRDLISDIEKAEEVQDKKTKTPVKILLIGQPRFEALARLYQDTGAILVLMQGLIAKDLDHQTALKVLTDEVDRLARKIPDEVYAQEELEAEEAFNQFRARLDEWKEHRLAMTEKKA